MAILECISFSYVLFQFLSTVKCTVAVNEKFPFGFCCMIIARCEHACSVLHTTLGKRNGTERKTITSGIERSTNRFTRGTVKCFRRSFKLPKSFFQVVVPLYSKLRRMALRKQLQEKCTFYLNGDAWP